MAEPDDGIDFALAAYREGGDWHVADLTHDHLVDVDTLAGALRRLPGDGGAVAMVAVDEDFFLIVRVYGSQTRVLLSDVTAAEDWDLASSAVDFLAMPDVDDLLDELLDAGDDEEQVPVGDLDLLGDLGLRAQELGLMLDDSDRYPDEVLSDIARQLGFGEQFDDAVGLSPA